MSRRAPETGRGRSTRPRVGITGSSLVLGVTIVALAVVGAMLWIAGSRGSGPAGVRLNQAPPTLRSTVAATPSAETTQTTELVVAKEETGPTVTRIGESRQGRPIDAVAFGSGEKRVLVIGGVHGDEYGDDVARTLLKKLKSDPDQLPEGCEIHVITSLNPDGVAAGTRGNSRRVDLNRNMPSSNWSSKLDDGDTSAAEGLSGGPSAGSEPESKALIAYAEEKRFDLVVSLHSAGGIVDFDGAGRQYAKVFSRQTGLPVSHLGYQPYVHGSMGLWFPEAFDSPVITVELDSPKLDPGLTDAVLEVAEDLD